MAQARPPSHITIPIYTGFDLLDVAAPVELFSWMAEEGIGTQTTATVGRVFLRSIPYSTTSLCGKESLFALRSTPPGPKPGGVFHFCLRTWHPPSGAVFGRFLPLFLSRSLLLADVQSAKSARQRLEKSVT
ncbi:hypothetical protein B0B51_18965 (plasmid) [blood disease bacterium A2-HR MARDI]|uniref:Uncharacterized protein n=2 Tax=Ralstonia syzygii subsp. celebesensis TaxID=1310168 RepID=A0A1U9VN37_9RALS|nr:hypothetical protein B0B51_18965 [blood disease bacterium A2-HR MARDI]CCA82731.1 putative transcriptional regulator [blood disease bacterium R229]